MTKIYVDGQEGTTGLEIFKRLEGRNNIEILKIDEDKRKDTAERKRLINEADIVFLCLPDDAAREAVTLVENENTRIIDASTAHRTVLGWVYGLPELSKEQPKLIANSKRVAVPGCHAAGFNMLVYPLVSSGIMPKDYPVNCFSVTGYSGGGKKLIASYESDEAPTHGKNPALYATGLKHKHIPEMQKISGFTYPPHFTPIISGYYKGMLVSVPIIPRLLSKPMGHADVHALFSDYYSDQRYVKVMPVQSETYLDNGYLNVDACIDTNDVQICVLGNDDNILISARFDNLGKGASGTAVQNMELMIGQ